MQFQTEWSVRVAICITGSPTLASELLHLVKVGALPKNTVRVLENTSLCLTLLSLYFGWRMHWEQVSGYIMRACVSVCMQFIHVL